MAHFEPIKKYYGRNLNLNQGTNLVLLFPYDQVAMATNQSGGKAIAVSTI